MVIRTNCENGRLIDEISKVEGFDIKYEDDENLYDVNYDALVLDELSTNLSEICDYKDKEIKCIFLYGDLYNQIYEYDRDFLELNNIVMLNKSDDVEMLTKFIVDKLSKNKDLNNVYGFFGADSKVGTTMISSLIAKIIARRSKDKTVFYLSLSGQSGIEWLSTIDYKSNINESKISMRNNMLSLPELKKISYAVYPNLFVLKGESNLVEGQLYHQKEIYNLLNLIRSNFDIVILDLGNSNNLTLRMTYAGLMKADNKILITNQFNKSLYMYENSKNQVLKYFDMQPFRFIMVNNYIDSSFLYKLRKLEEYYKLSVIAKLPFVEDNFKAQYDGNPEVFLQDKEFMRGITKVIEWIERKQNFTVFEKKKKGIKKIFNRGV